jgi:hypothetical protein
MKWYSSGTTRRAEMGIRPIDVVCDQFDGRIDDSPPPFTDSSSVGPPSA